ncbi:prolyl oligopeptidase family serine peptidase [Actinoplanes sp. NPDC049265]|uniref:S9 family peptidase n=1 Tax=Actinoplanes sp. NPDC049265 TaxID=3363902 RepID=UPI003710C383
MTFPDLFAETLGFSYGRARSFRIAPDGSRVLFLRSNSGTDRVHHLWSFDVAGGSERLLVDAATLGADQDAPMSEQERARRERTRDRAAGIGAFAADEGVHSAVFAVSGRLYAVDVATGEVTALDAAEPATEARIDPTGRTVAYVVDGALRVVGRDGKDDRALARPDGPEVTWGLPEHEAAESMDRYEGFWWAPDGDRLLAARVDNERVQVWHIADPAHPEKPPVALRYPAAGTPNADVSLHILGLDGVRVEVGWDRAGFEYVTRVVWDRHGPLIVVQNRRQTVMRVLAVDPATGATSLVAESTDPRWTTIVDGVPARLGDGALVWTIDDGDTRRLTVGGTPVTPPGLQVEKVLAVDGPTVLFTGRDEPTERHLWTWSAAAGPERLTSAPGVHTGHRAGGVTVVETADLDGARVTVGGHELRSVAAESPVEPRPRFVTLGERELRAAVFFPTGYAPGTARLPVLMDPYGGSAAQKAEKARNRFWGSQWFADQGFAVIVADGRGTPGRGPRWERARGDDHAGPRLQDQVDALRAAAELLPGLDLTRVGIRGWSAGGYLAALAVLRRPDVFHAAVAGAPVIDQLLYSSHWQERTLGLPAENPEGYARGSLLADAPHLRRPLLLVHGMLDDNVLPLHSMRLSAALLAAGRPHSVLPLPGASHMGAYAKNLWQFQLDFFRTSLGL